jgi:hypothetical protein
MEYLFRRFRTNDLPAPAPGEIHLRPRSPEPQAGRKLAQLAVEQGPSAFLAGDGPVERLVIQADPTLDDMLAAAFIERLLAGAELPAGARAFALYAGHVREGLKTTSLPIKDSLEGIYLAIRNEAGGDLEQPDARARFLASWPRIAQVILQAAEAGRDPTTASLFEGDPHFDGARAYLAHDREVYASQDVPGGQRWLMRLPDGPREQVPGLVLCRPRSMLWKAWSREDPDAPGGKGYLFLGVFEKESHWVFSTNPVHRLPIPALAGALQKAEAAKDPARAPQDPWYDGRRHSHTLVAAPHAGTALEDQDVLHIVKRWAHAHRIGKKRKLKAPVLAAAAALVLAVGGFGLGSGGWFRPVFAGSGSSEDNGTRGQAAAPGKDSRGMEVIDPQDPKPAAAPGRKGKDYALLIATNTYTGGWPSLTNPIPDAVAIQKKLEETYGFQTELVKNPTKVELLASFRKYIKKLKDSGSDDDQLFIFIAGHGEFDRETNEGYLVAKDSKRRSDDQELETYCAHSLLQNRIDSIPCKHIFVVLDICFSGTFDRKIATAARGASEYEETSREEFIRRKLQGKTRKYLASGGREPVPDGKAGRHSPFAAKFIDALESRGNKYGIVTFSRIKDHVETIKPNQPHAGDFGEGQLSSDFLFIVKPPAPSKAAVAKN